MITHIPQPIDLSSSERDGHLHFDDQILAKAGMLGELFDFRVRYEAFAVKERGEKHTQLVEKHDELVLEHRRVKGIHDAAKANKFAIIQRLNEAARTANHASALYTGLKQSLEDRSGSFETMAERVEKADRLEKLRVDADAAVLFHSGIISELQSFEYRLVEAGEKLNAATVAVVGAKRAIDVFLGKKGVHSSENGLAMS